MDQVTPHEKPSHRFSADTFTARTVITNARFVQPQIADLTFAERLERIRVLKDLILEQRESIIDRIQKETRKSRTDALMSEIFPALDHLEYLEKNTYRVLSDRSVSTPIALMGKKSKVFFEPLGVILAISPWNYPFYQAVVPCTLSFVCGNATLLKPSEHTPLQGLIEDLFKKAGFKENWVQVIYGGGSVGQSLLEAGPDKVFFTGSTRTGKKIMESAAKNLVAVELELGGKDPMIVFEDVNLKRAAAGATWGALTNCGQTCTSVERIYVQKSIYEEFKTALLKEFQQIKQGVDLDGSTEIGEMTVDFQAQIIRQHLEDAEKKGAKILTGAEWGRSGGEDVRKIPPILLDSVSPASEITHEETFGPTLPLIPFETEKEVIEMANNSEYGLSASVWSKNQARALRVARKLEVGNVSINNVMLSEGNHALPFGGVKNSGFGRYKGEFGFYAFSNIKAVLIDKDSSKIEANWYPYTPTKYQLFTNMMVNLFSRKGGLIRWIRFAVAGLKLESYSNKAGRKVNFIKK
jgi:acyl-CoA reductase-like NAD-dependent aldehyde dehydrogenase